MLLAWHASNHGRPQWREDEAMRIDRPRRGDPTVTDPRFPAREAVSVEREGGTAMTEPVRFSNAFCLWLRVGGPLL